MKPKLIHRLCGGLVDMRKLKKSKIKEYDCRKCGKPVDKKEVFEDSIAPSFTRY